MGVSKYFKSLKVYPRSRILSYPPRLTNTLVYTTGKRSLLICNLSLWVMVVVLIVATVITIVVLVIMITVLFITAVVGSVMVTVVEIMNTPGQAHQNYAHSNQ
jgi:hypothetical protein